MLPGSSKPNNKGFSLLEVLLAVVITTMMGGIIYGIIFTGVEMAARIRQEHTAARQIRTVLDALDNDLENMTVFNLQNDFVGSENYLELMLVQGGTLKRIRYRVSANEMGSATTGCATLWREEKVFFDPPEKYQAEILADDIQADSFRLAYAYKSDNGTDNSLVWRNAWQQKDVPAGIHWEFALCTSAMAGNNVVRRDIFVPLGNWGKINDAAAQGT